MSIALKIGPCMGRSGPPSNTWFLGPTRVHIPNGFYPHPKRTSSVLSFFCRTIEHGRFNCDICFTGPTRVNNPNGISIGSAVFAQLTSELLYFTMGHSFSLKIAPSNGASELPSSTLFLGPTQILNLNCISIGSAVFAQITAERPYTLQWTALYPQNCPFPWGIWTPT